MEPQKHKPKYNKNNMENKKNNSLEQNRKIIVTFPGG